MKDQMKGLAITIAPVTVEKKRNKKMSGGKTMKPAKTSYTYKEGGRVMYAEGGKGIEALRKEAPEVVARMGYEEGSEVKEEPSSKDKILEVLENINRFFKRDFGKEKIDAIAGLKQIQKELMEHQAEREEYEKNKDTIKEERQAKGIFYEGEEGFNYREPDDNVPFAEGGDVDAQMAMMMPMAEAMPAEETMMPDEQMEDEYLDFIVSQSLSSEEEMSLMNKLEADPELSVMFDKLMDTATEFSGSGPVDGPGSEVSDSIPARLSDGEFVFTAKATEQVGADRLQSMMEDAEAEADAGRQEVAQGGAIDEEKVDQYGKPVDEDIAEDEIRRGMLSVNPRLQ